MTLFLERLCLLIGVGGAVGASFKYYFELFQCFLAFQWVLRVCLITGVFDAWCEMESGVVTLMMTLMYIIISLLVFNFMVGNILNRFKTCCARMKVAITERKPVSWDETKGWVWNILTNAGFVFLFVIFAISMWWFSGVPIVEVFYRVYVGHNDLAAQARAKVDFHCVGKHAYSNPLCINALAYLIWITEWTPISLWTYVDAGVQTGWNIFFS